VHLTTKGRKTGKDHIVELWFASADGKIYLSHEGEYTDWMKNLQKNANVRMKIGSATFSGEAKLTLPKSSERDEGARALYTKYYGSASKETLNDWFELSTVVLVTPE